MKRTAVMNIIIFFLIVFSGIAHALCVTVSDANLRSGPGTNYQKTWEVFKYMPFQKINRKGDWYKIKDVDGDTHWIYRKLVTDKFNCAVVKVEKANVRTGPGEQFNEEYFSPSLKYDSYKVLKRKGEWINVQDEFGATGWIFRKLLWIY
jgi:SH3-like domain-containing protein